MKGRKRAQEKAQQVPVYKKTYMFTQTGIP